MSLESEEFVETPSAFVARNWRDLIRPRKLEVDSESLSQGYGRFACEPLERGFATTLGNGLRRILLSSLQGCAITAVKIEGLSTSSPPCRTWQKMSRISCST